MARRRVAAKPSYCEDCQGWHVVAKGAGIDNVTRIVIAKIAAGLRAHEIAATSARRKATMAGEARHDHRVGRRARNGRPAGGASASSPAVYFLTTKPSPVDALHAIADTVGRISTRSAPKLTRDSIAGNGAQGIADEGEPPSSRAIGQDPHSNAGRF